MCSSTQWLCWCCCAWQRAVSVTISASSLLWWQWRRLRHHQPLGHAAQPFQRPCHQTRHAVHPPPPQNVAVQCGALCLASGAPHEPHPGTHTTATAAAADPPGAMRVTATTQNRPPPAAVSPAPQPAAHTTPSTCSASHPATTATASSASSSRRVWERGLTVQCGGGPSTTPPVPQPACAHAPHHSTATQCGASQLRSHHWKHQQPQKPPGSSTT